MVFASFEFMWLFLPFVLVIYYALCKTRWARLPFAFLVGASLFYYAFWNYKYLAIILVSILGNFVMSAWIQHALSVRHRLILTVAGIGANVAALCYYKYTDFFLQTVNQVAGTSIPLPHIVLPIGISFFTFQQIAFLVDCYKGAVKERNFLSYCLFICFFPQLVAGPIVHHSEMMPQFSHGEARTFNGLNFYRGMTLLFWGLGKKVIIADSLAPFIKLVFDVEAMKGNIECLTAWLGSLAYTFQLYLDFSGYSDMAIGLGLLFNIRLPQNFLSPYTSLNIQDFWRRWHVTLSRWLMAYIYIPLGGNRSGLARTLVNLFLTFLIGGIWHGAGWTFVLWGVMHGSALVIHRLWKLWIGNRKEAVSFAKARVFSCWLATFLFINTAWVMFRAKSVTCAMHMYTSMCGVQCSVNVKDFVVAVWKRLFCGGFAMGIASRLGVGDCGIANVSLVLFGTTLVTFGFWKLYDTSSYRERIQPHWACTGFALVLYAVSYILIGEV
ncbi:MAG: MBOAT family protein, partial [Holosporales bacterium]|nr:MBOAT family protein [Holosporales bacterium]